MQTRPVPLQDLGAAPGELDEFRIAAPREVALILRHLCDAGVRLYLNSITGDTVLTTSLWSMDIERGSIGFTVEADDPALPLLLERGDAVVVAYLDSIKLQFDVHNLLLVHGARTSILNCTYPSELYRFQRRNTFRVRPLQRNTPMAHVRHSEPVENAETADTSIASLALRVLDVSIGGCALFLPDEISRTQPRQWLKPGSLLPQAHFDLDADTRFNVNLQLHHVTLLSADAKGVRLGCEFVRADSSVLRALQRFIDQTQKRAKLLAVG